MKDKCAYEKVLILNSYGDEQVYIDTFRRLIRLMKEQNKLDGKSNECFSLIHRPNHDCPMGMSMKMEFRWGHVDEKEKPLPKSDDLSKIS